MSATLKCNISNVCLLGSCTENIHLSFCVYTNSQNHELINSIHANINVFSITIAVI